MTRSEKPKPWLFGRCGLGVVQRHRRALDVGQPRRPSRARAFGPACSTSPQRGARRRGRRRRGPAAGAQDHPLRGVALPDLVVAAPRAPAGSWPAGARPWASGAGRCSAPPASVRRGMPSRSKGDLKLGCRPAVLCPPGGRTRDVEGPIGTSNGHSGWLRTCELRMKCFANSSYSVNITGPLPSSCSPIDIMLLVALVGGELGLVVGQRVAAPDRPATTTARAPPGRAGAGRPTRQSHTAASNASSGDHEGAAPAPWRRRRGCRVSSSRPRRGNSVPASSSGPNARRRTARTRPSSAAATSRCEDLVTGWVVRRVAVVATSQSPRPASTSSGAGAGSPGPLAFGERRVVDRHRGRGAADERQGEQQADQDTPPRPASAVRRHVRARRAQQNPAAMSSSGAPRRPAPAGPSDAHRGHRAGDRRDERARRPPVGDHQRATSAKIRVISGQRRRSP